MAIDTAPPTSAPKPALLCDLQHVTKTYAMPSGANVKVLEDVSLAVNEEEILALLGPSGCGKSTMMRVLAGLIQPESGKVLYRGAPLPALNPGVAIVFQSFALYPWLTVAENIGEALLARGMKPTDVRASVEKVVHLVGLTGFEDAYPRELSGGMKQRVGIARALAVEPEILCMDEPFSQVDALTAETLRGEVVRFWSDKATNPKTIFMVSHDVKEVVFMATRIVVMAAKPGRIRHIFENPLPYPRDYRSPAFQRLVDEIHALITEIEMPDKPMSEVAEVVEVAGVAGVAKRKPNWEPLPDASASEVTGLLEVLDDRGGQDDVFDLVEHTGQEFSKVLAVVKAAELIDMVDTPKQDVVLTEAGRRFLKLSVPERKVMFREQVQTLNIFKDVLGMLARADRHEVDEEAIESSLAVRLPYEDPERLFRTLVNWGRTADLFDHDVQRKKLFIEPPPGTASTELPTAD